MSLSIKGIDNAAHKKLNKIYKYNVLCCNSSLEAIYVGKKIVLKFTASFIR
jgi:hypothetical protein